ncbi:hypothetical protein EXS74_03430 [Candidatus Woesearchaeota archaeon]|nr:hypothetical protein [Candidatus Woesearchaeota archaeon]
MALENIVGNLRDAYALVEPETILHSDELQLERLTNNSLRSVPFYTADGVLYRMHDGKAQLGLTRRDQNPVLRHIGDAFTQLVETGNYHPNGDSTDDDGREIYVNAQEEADAAFTAESTVRIDLIQLCLQGTDNEWRYLAIPTQNYSTLSPEERKLAERVHGSGDAFVQVMRMLADAGIRETKVYVLNPSYVEAQTKKGIVGRASWLNHFGGIADFYAGSRNIINSVRLRGVRSHPVASISEPGAHGVRDMAENVYVTSYATILSDPERAVAALDDVTASGLCAIVSQYLASKRQ